MSEAVVAAAAPSPPKARGGFLHPYVQLGVGAVLVSASELLLKKGADAAPTTVPWLTKLGIAALASGWTWGGIVTYLLSFASWLYVLRYVPLGLAFAVINVVHVLVPLGCLVFLHEPVSARRWVGIALVVGGLVLLMQQVVKAESKL